MSPSRFIRGAGFSSVLFAALSALLLAAAHLSPSFWFLSLIAFAPFFHEASRAGPNEAARLGAVLGAVYVLVIGHCGPSVYPVLPASTLVVSVLVLSLFGLVVSVSARYRGLSALFVAFAWIPLEYVLSLLPASPRLFPPSAAEGTVFGGFAYLFGTLAASFLVMLVNALVFVAAEKILTGRRSRRRLAPKSNEKHRIMARVTGGKRESISLADARAPPGLSFRSNR